MELHPLDPMGGNAAVPPSTAVAGDCNVPLISVSNWPPVAVGKDAPKGNDDVANIPGRGVGGDLADIIAAAGFCRRPACSRPKPGLPAGLNPVDGMLRRGSCRG
mmetsp:Transcript_134555/g.268564  ORF Transcript_134555/g.268564 Transcript_134555/m.268564 type:complete len:104 (+) Transcript_134555:579-890(+)